MAYYNTNEQGYITGAGSSNNWFNNLFNPSAQQNAQYELNYNLALRQQQMAEESYYNGIINEANQLSQLGINPAAYGQDLSGSSYSGSSGSGSTATGANGMSALTGMLGSISSIASVVAGIKQKNEELNQRDRELDIAQQGADDVSKKTNQDISESKSRERLNMIQSSWIPVLNQADIKVKNAQTEVILDNLNFFREHGYNPGSGWQSSLQGNLTSAIISSLPALLLIYMNSRNNNNNNNNRGSGSGSSGSDTVTSTTIFDSRFDSVEDYEDIIAESLDSVGDFEFKESDLLNKSWLDKAIDFILSSNLIDSIGSAGRAAVSAVLGFLSFNPGVIGGII